MESFNNKLKEISILELIGVVILSIILLVVLEVNIEWISVFIIVYVLFRTRNELGGLKSCATNLFSKISFKTWLLLGIANYIFALGSAVYLTEMFPDLFNIFGLMSITNNITYIGMDILLSIILGPIFEELVFRGIIFNRLDKRLPLAAAIIISSYFFCSFHSYQTYLSCFVFGAAMCIAYLMSENILVPITLHMFNNLISMAVSYIPNIGLIFDSEIGMLIVGILTIISLIYLLIFIVNGYKEVKSIN